MTQTAKKIAKAFLKGKGTLTIKNTKTDGINVWHHGHLIARYNHAEGFYQFNMCGYGTLTTRDRLNAIARLLNRPPIYQRQFIQYRTINNQQEEVATTLWNNF